MAVGLFVLILGVFKTAIGKQEGFIVGGDVVATIRQYPHVAFLTLKSSEGTFICGSSILNQIILITAAHCFEDITKITASVGSLNRKQGTIYEVKSYKQHENFDPATVRNDVGLCRLKQPLEFGTKVKRVVLLKNPPSARIADLTGWGAVEEDYYRDSIVLKHTKQKLWSRNQCREVLKNTPEGTICGGQSDASGDFASKGDSGSGLLIKKKILVGLVSYKNTFFSKSLVIYTDVAYFYDWITSTAKQLSCG